MDFIQKNSTFLCEVFVFLAFNNYSITANCCIMAALQYVSKYASKAEPRSISFSEVLDKALRNDKPNESGVKASQ
jgi:hypothetical protein